MTDSKPGYVPSAKDFLTLGCQRIAYIKPIVVGDRQAFAVFAADGASLAVLEDRDSAVATVIYNEMTPLIVN